MGGTYSKLTPPSTQPLVVDAPIDTTQAAAGSNTTATAEPTPNVTPEVTSSTFELLGKRKYLDVVGKISDYDPRFSLLNRHAAASAKTGEADQIRNKTITKKLLTAVAYGMESKEVNVNPEPKDLFAEDLLKKSPEFLLERGDITDWGGRTFKNITAFEYALWAKDFKMLEMMARCIPQTSEGDEIRAALLEQYNQVKAPIYAGGGLTYSLTYDQPCQDANGIPIKDAAGVWQTIPVTEIHTENHFDVTPLLTAFQDYDTNFNTRTWPQRDACWIKIIGTLQRLLPIHLLQRYCEPDTPFYPLPEFTGVFKRTTQFYNLLSRSQQALLSSSLSTDFSLFRGRAGCCEAAREGPPRRGWEGSRVVGRPSLGIDLPAVRRIDEVSTNEIETKIKQQLTPTAQSQTQFRT